MQNVCLVTTQSFKRGKSGRQNMETFAFASAVRGYHVYQELFTPSVGEKFVAKREFNNTIDQQAVKVVKGVETVSQLPRKFSRIVWYFLYVVEKSVLKWLVDAEEWRFYGSLNLTSQTKELLLSKSRVRTVLKILTYGSFRSHRKQWSTTGFIMCNLYLLKVFSSICDKNKPVYFLRKEWSCV